MIVMSEPQLFNQRKRSTPRVVSTLIEYAGPDRDAETDKDDFV